MTPHRPLQAPPSANLDPPTCFGWAHLQVCSKQRSRTRSKQLERGSRWGRIRACATTASLTALGRWCERRGLPACEYFFITDRNDWVQLRVQHPCIGIDLTRRPTCSPCADASPHTRVVVGNDRAVPCARRARACSHLCLPSQSLPVPLVPRSLVLQFQGVRAHNGVWSALHRHPDDRIRAHETERWVP